jgi:hypothetical protein
LGSVAPIGPRLALDLVDDGMVRSLPRWRERLIAHGLHVLYEPSPPDLAAITRILVRFADTGDEQRKIIADGLREALSGRPAVRATAERIQVLVEAAADEISARPDTRGLRGVRKRQGVFAPPTPPDGWADFNDEVMTHPAIGASLARVHDAAAAIRTIKVRRGVDEDSANAIIAALKDSVAAEAISAALRHVIAHEPGLATALRDEVLPFLHRAAVGELLRP